MKILCCLIMNIFLFSFSWYGSYGLLYAIYVVFKASWQMQNLLLKIWTRTMTVCMFVSKEIFQVAWMVRFALFHSTLYSLFNLNSGTVYILQNIRVMAKYYTRIRMRRMGELLDLSEAVSNFKSSFIPTFHMI